MEALKSENTNLKKKISTYRDMVGEIKANQKESETKTKYKSTNLLFKLILQFQIMIR